MRIVTTAARIRSLQAATFMMATVEMLLISLGPISALAGASFSAGDNADLEQARLKVIQAVNEDPDHFGGVLVQDDGSLVVLYVGANDGRTAVEEHVSDGLSVLWRKVDHSYSELMRVLRETSDRNLDGVWALSIDAANNQVKVRVSPADRATEIAGTLTDVGTPITVVGTDNPPVIHACVDRFACTPWRGGIQVNMSNSDCTWGYLASRNGNLQMITAGHCGAVGSVGYHNNALISSVGVGRNAINPATFEGIDVLRMKVSPNGAGFPTTQNLIYAIDADKAHAMSIVRPYSQFASGQLVGLAGADPETGGFFYEGAIEDVFAEWRLRPGPGGTIPYYPNCTYNNWTTTCPKVWGFTSTATGFPGTSGGPVVARINYPPYITQTLVGFDSVGDGQTEWMSVADAVTTALDLDFWCTTPGCP